MSAPSRFVTGAGRIIYSFRVRSFPTLVNNIYIIDDGEGLILVDCGSGMPQANAELAAGHWGKSASPAIAGCDG